MIKKIVSSIEINRNLGLLVIRIGIGLSMMIFHGFAKIKGGPELWSKIGTEISVVGINFLPVFWGFMAAFSEFFCSLFIIIGILFRPAAVLLAMTMTVAILMHLNLPADNPSSGWSGASHALEFLAVYIGLLFTGPGKYKVY